MATPISILTEIPEELHCSLRNYLDGHPTWDQDQVITAALSLFLLKSYGNNEELVSSEAESQSCARIYLETLFQT